MIFTAFIWTHAQHNEFFCRKWNRELKFNFSQSCLRFPFALIPLENGMNPYFPLNYGQIVGRLSSLDFVEGKVWTETSFTQLKVVLM